MTGQLVLNGTYWRAETYDAPDITLSGSLDVSPIGSEQIIAEIAGDESFGGFIGGTSVTTGSYASNPTPGPTSGFSATPDPLDLGTAIENTACGSRSSTLTGTIQLSAPSNVSWTAEFSGYGSSHDFGNYVLFLSPASGTGSRSVTVQVRIRQSYLTTGCHNNTSTSRLIVMFVGSNNSVAMVNLVFRLLM